MIAPRSIALLAAILAVPAAGWAQTFSPTYGRVSFHVNTATHSTPGESPWSDTELWTGVDFHTPESEAAGPEFGLDLRHSIYPGTGREQRVSLYDGFAGLRMGGTRQLRVRAGHMWVPELGSIGALAGGLAEVRLASSEQSRIRIGAFSGLEPVLYDTGYESGVRKHGGYLAIERGFLRRSLIGYTLIRQGSMTERSVVTTTNYVPVGKSFFLYQAAEIDVQGPADGTASRGLSYFLANGRMTATRRIELLGTYNRGRALDARTLTGDLRNGRPLTAEAIDGLRYESAGTRMTVEVVPQIHVYAGYSRDRNNRDDAATNRVTLGGHAADVLRRGFDVSLSGSRMERPTGPYHSMFASIGRNIGRTLYVSADYSTSLAVVRFVGLDGIAIESRPSMRRISGTGSATIARDLSLLVTVDYSRDDQVDETRLLAGLSFRLR
jgi:hypothetical protein